VKADSVELFGARRLGSRPSRAKQEGIELLLVSRQSTRDRGFDANGVAGEKGWYVQPSRITLARAPRVLLLRIASSAIEMTVPANDRSVPGGGRHLVTPILLAHKWLMLRRPLMT
jgi:hypothetical protein